MRKNEIGEITRDIGAGELASPTHEDTNINAISLNMAVEEFLSLPPTAILSEMSLAKLMLINLGWSQHLSLRESYDTYKLYTEYFSSFMSPTPQEKFCVADLLKTIENFVLEAESVSEDARYRANVAYIQLKIAFFDRYIIPLISAKQIGSCSLSEILDTYDKT